MSMQKFVRRATGFVFALTFAGAAFARQPPALVQAQAAQGLDSGSSYRDGYARLQHREITANAYAASGYRDSLTRLPARRTSVAPRFGSIPASESAVCQARTTAC
jgi:hypothetical protein